MLFSPAILAGATASLPLALLNEILKAMGADDPEEDFYGWLADLHPAAERFGRHGAAGLAGMNLKGSLQINNPMPTTVPEIFGAPAGVLTDLYDAGVHLKRGEYLKGFEKAIPTGLGSGLKAVREYKEGVTTSSYSPVYYGDQPLKGSGLDAALRFFSFNPSRLSGIREKQYNEYSLAKRYRRRKKKINSKIKHAYLKHGRNIPDHVWAEIRKDIVRYNELVRGTGRTDIRPITPRSVRQVIKGASRAPKRERLRRAA